MITILFVDDEPEILDGIRFRLRRKRNTWTQLFAQSVDEALMLLEKHRVDLLVTDLRMPERTGFDLLEIVGRDYPSVTRAVLSGTADDPEVIDALPVLARVLRKPCDGEQLERLVRHIEARN